MNIRSISIVAAFVFSALISVSGAQQAEDLPNALEAERQARNAAYKMRLRESKDARRKNLRDAANSAAQRRSRARRERLASQTEPKAPAGFDPFQPIHDLNGEQLETFDDTYLRGQGTGYRRSNRAGYGYGYVTLPAGNRPLGVRFTR